MSKETAFAVFCLESYKVYKSLTGKQPAEGLAHVLQVGMAGNHPVRLVNQEK